MAAYLYEWLGKTIEKELGGVLEQRAKSEFNPSVVRGRVDNITFEDDGSDLRIKSAKPQVVQIIKVRPWDSGV